MGEVQFHAPVMWGFAMLFVLGNGMWTDVTSATSYQKMLEVVQVSISHLELLPSAITVCCVVVDLSAWLLQ